MSDSLRVATSVTPGTFYAIICLRCGGVSERFMETVLKTVLVLVASVGSNPTPSANCREALRLLHHVPKVRQTYGY
jgi:hypothetical protein